MKKIKVEEISDSVFQLASPRPSCHVYLVKSSIKNVLIDTGTDARIDDLCVALSELGLSVKDIHLVINTHEHFDHIGANKYFYDTAIIAAGRFAATKIEQDDKYVTMLGSMGTDHHRTNPHLWLENRNLFDLEDFHLKIFETPGHTSGCICVYEPFKRLLFSGDTVFAKGTLSAIAPSGSAGDYIDSIERLNTLKISFLFPGHGKISKDPESDLLIAAENAKQRLRNARVRGETDEWSESTPLDIEEAD